MNPRELLESNVALVDAIVARVCRRARLFGADADDFAASVKLALIEDDYAILRRFEGRASLSTYLTIVVERMLADERVRARGRWHPSAEATRLGEAAVLLETIIVRERRSLDEALPRVRALDPAITRASAEALLARLPERRPRPVAAPLDDVPMLVAAERADAVAFENETRRLSDRVTQVVRDVLASLSTEDRMLIRFRFGGGMSIADISRMLRLPQRPLYRRIEALLRRLREALEGAGLDGAAAQQILETSTAADLDFGIVENGEARQTNSFMERA